MILDIQSILQNKANLGWNPELEFEDGLKQTILWYIDNKNLTV